MQERCTSVSSTTAEKLYSTKTWNVPEIIWSLWPILLEKQKAIKSIQRKSQTCFAERIFEKKLVKGLSKKYWQSQLFLKTIKKSVLKYKYEQRKGDKIVKAALYYWKFSTLRTAPYIQISVFYSRILDKLHFHRVQLRIMGICLFVFLLQIPGLLRLHRLWM